MLEDTNRVLQQETFPRSAGAGVAAHGLSLDGHACAELNRTASQTQGANGAFQNATRAYSRVAMEFPASTEIPGLLHPILHPNFVETARNRSNWAVGNGCRDRGRKTWV
eukprot:412095-Rhodomonas_salina.3